MIQSDEETTQSSFTKPFPSGQRTKRPPLTWSVWMCRNTVFLFIKFLVLLAFYSMHQHHETVHEEHEDGLGSLYHGLSQFRRDSRVGRHDKKLLRDGKKTNTTIVDAASLSLWERLPQPCPSSILDPFPESFDLVYYQEQYKDVDYQHYLTVGREKGLRSSRGQELREILATEVVPLMAAPTVLELGPFINPLLRGENVEYFDVANWKGLVKKANELDYIISPDPVEITYVDESGDLSGVMANNSYNLIVSSHVLTVQNDLVRHLQSVSRLLHQDGGYYAAFVKDKRYGSEHFMEESTLADVLEDFHSERRAVSLRSLIESATLEVPNRDSSRHWKNDQNKVPYRGSDDPEQLQQLQRLVEDYQNHDTSSVNIDIPQYHFTPHTLATMIDTLYTMGLTDLRVHQLYDTVSGADEFCIVLRRCPNRSSGGDKAEQ